MKQGGGAGAGKPHYAVKSLFLLTVPCVPHPTCIVGITLSLSVLQVIMIGGVFLYNHKGEVMVSRVFRDNIT